MIKSFKHIFSFFFFLARSHKFGRQGQALYEDDADDDYNDGAGGYGYSGDNYDEEYDEDDVVEDSSDESSEEETGDKKNDDK